MDENIKKEMKNWDDVGVYRLMGFSNFEVLFSLCGVPIVSNVLGSMYWGTNTQEKGFGAYSTYVRAIILLQKNRFGGISSLNSESSGLLGVLVWGRVPKTLTRAP